jgi:site-specific DNA recombinase
VIFEDWSGKRIAIYARYSSDQQRESSLEDQVRRATEFAARHGVVEPQLVFRDAARSGATLHRPEFKNLMGSVEDGQVDLVLTEDVSRLSRDMADAAQVYKRLQFREVILIGIADGLDTRQQGAKVLFSMKAMAAELYLDDLRYKTRRGLEGRMMKGLATGGRLLGYRTTPVLDAKGQAVGASIHVHVEEADVVRRIFSAYAAGHSLLSITRRLNVDGVAVLRPHRKNRKQGWIASTVRETLHNAQYIGDRKYLRKEWRRDPETGKRRYKKRTEGVLSEQRPDLRIIPDELWNAVQTRLGAVRQKYAGPDGEPKGRAAPGRVTAYPFSGLLVCSCCDTPMVIGGGSTMRYYRCGDLHKRGMCSNKLSVREPLVRDRLLSALTEHIASPWAVRYIRKQFAQAVGSGTRRNEEELRKQRNRLARVEQRLRGFVDMWADGMRGDEVRTAWEDAKAEMKSTRLAVAALERAGAEPIRLPSPAEVEERILDLRRLAETTPIEARQVLANVFGGRIEMHPQADGPYLAKTEILPLVLIGPETAKPQPGEPDWGFYRVYIDGCAGRI